MCAGEKDWNHVVKECSSLSAKWEDLSIYLGLSANTIGTIKRDNPGNTRGCWNQALLEWIKQSYNTSEHGEPSWRTLLRAVAEEDRLSFKKLSQKHQGKQIIMHGVNRILNNSSINLFER